MTGVAGGVLRNFMEGRPSGGPGPAHLKEFFLKKGAFVPFCFFRKKAAPAFPKSPPNPKGKARRLF
jgi:hypothetical protein